MLLDMACSWCTSIPFAAATCSRVGGGGGGVDIIDAGERWEILGVDCSEGL